MDGGYGGIIVLADKIRDLERGRSRLNRKIDALAEALGKTMELVPERYEVQDIEKTEEEVAETPAEY